MKSAQERSELATGRWLGIGLRSLFTLFLLLSVAGLSRCTQPEPPTVPVPTTPVAVASAPALATLRVEVQPHGAIVRIDGLRSGTTPLSIDLAAGEHKVQVEQECYEPQTWTVNLSAGSRETVDGQLPRIATCNEPTVTLAPTPLASPGELPDLLVSRASIESEKSSGCAAGTAATLGLRVWIENAGQGPAGPFNVEANGVQQAVAEGLAAGASTSLWFPGYAAGAENVVTVDVADQVQELDESSNVYAAMLPIPTPLPTCTPAATQAVVPPPPPSTPAPTPAPTAIPVVPVTVRGGTVTLPTYPYAAFTRPGKNDAFNMTYLALDRAAYDASGPVPQEQSYPTLIVENEYLALTFLPDIGGRLYEVVYKPTGHRETYRNPVLKPSPWGPPEMGWWLAAGGIEWCLPVEEHGYEWGVPWKSDVTRDGGGVTVTLRDTEAQDRVRAEIQVRLEAGSAAFTIRPRLENPTGAPLAVKYWTNAMLAPGGANAPSAQLRFVLPAAVQSVTVHSRGDETLPGAGQRLPWPVHNGVDLSRLGNWNRWLGFFEDPAVGEFMAVYDPTYDEGMVRVFPPQVARGAKVFGFGWQDPIAPNNWTDDRSGYVEIHGGPAPTFDTSVTIPAGGSLQWTETWYPVAGVGELRLANQHAALGLSAGGGQVELSAAVVRFWAGDAILLVNGQELWRQAIALLPGQPFRHTVSLGEAVPATGRVTWRLANKGGAVAAEYSADLDLQ